MNIYFSPPRQSYPTFHISLSMLKLEYSNTISKKEFFIGSIKVYVYNADILPAYVELFKQEHKCLNIPVNVLYLVHHRQGDYSYTEAVAERVVAEYSKDAKVPMIAVTFDIANHGERKVSELANEDWRSGNETHALDMISCIDLTIHDLKLIMDFLPGYLDLDAHVNASLKEENVGLKFHNILAGYSIGGHVVIRFASRYPELVSAINPNVGCSDLTSLLYNRLKRSKNFDKKFFYSTYGELELDATERKRYPEALHKYLSQEDMQIFERFPVNQVLMYATFYDDDPLVPPRISKLWVDTCLNSNTDSAVYYEKGRIHDITLEMVDGFISWLRAKADLI
ncbi:hypothetical protein PUMCH_000496 [Australozyma saopauloensis]|uniref:AB hydrolase-1 domain-containing protein n=1 Tax=Australozyma saopauloensis TaxID=291208 RepID=A0AAX4H3X7_9ASCO|nr:hypothetical protein PUMCH_000496 [[Candida] saopauloensis]